VGRSYTWPTVRISPIKFSGKDEDIGKTAKQLKDFCRLMMKLNPNVSMNIFFHQSDVDIYNGEKTTDGIQILMEAVESIRDPAMGPNKNSNSNNQTAGFFFTSIYDASINESSFYPNKANL
jgi:hypothetical protein